MSTTTTDTEPVHIYIHEPASISDAIRAGATQDELADLHAQWDSFDAQRQELYRLQHLASFTNGYFVNVYEVDRCYGGPEEGGWWFDAGEVIHSFHLTSYDEATTLVEILRSSDQFSSTTERFSAAARHADYSVRLEPTAGASFPEEYPHYE